jgi:hypothetical protein
LEFGCPSIHQPPASQLAARHHEDEENSNGKIIGVAFLRQTISWYLPFQQEKKLFSLLPLLRLTLLLFLLYFSVALRGEKNEELLVSRTGCKCI